MTAHPGEGAILVHIHFPTDGISEDLDEFKELARSAGAHVVEAITGTRKAPDPKYFVGTGKAEEIRLQVEAHGVKLVLVNHNLSPTQERNLEKLLQCRVLDRTELILDIFAQRARSFEGKLQVELAFLSHMATRLVRGWTHLERQRGGIGLRGGPGETQLETDRRLIRARIKTIKGRLEKVQKQRHQNRRARDRTTIPTVALVGYTNVGKSTLFNVLTRAKVQAEDKLFATLDPTLRRAYMGNDEQGKSLNILLADTVGFIRHLPHQLIDAFHATLEEVAKADLLLHIVDMNDPHRQLHIEQVNKVLKEIDADDRPQILVYNKIDLCDGVVAHTEAQIEENPACAFISAESKLGLEALKALVLQILSATNLVAS